MFNHLKLRTERSQKKSPRKKGTILKKELLYQKRTIPEKEKFFMKNDIPLKKNGPRNKEHSLKSMNYPEKGYCNYLKQNVPRQKKHVP